MKEFLEPKKILSRNPEKNLKEKLFIPRNVEGEFDDTSFKIARDMHEMFKNEKGYVGLIIFDSSVDGFYSDEKSDVDIRFLYDSSLYKEWSFLGKKISGSFFSKIDRLIKKSVRQLKSKYQKEIHVPYWFFYDINPKKITENLSAGKIGHSSESLAELIGLSMGDKVEGYRDYFKRFLTTLSEEKRKEIKDEIINFKLKEENASSKKRLSRSDQFSSESTSESLSARCKLWEKRIEKIYGI